jgi:hypothetical protein
MSQFDNKSPNNLTPATVMPAASDAVVNRNVRALLDRAERTRFYGTITIRYENGYAVHVRREESILPSRISTTTGTATGGTQ